MRRCFTSAAIALALVGSSCSSSPKTAVSVEPDPPVPVVEYVTRQEILTPLPLRVRLPARYGAERVLVFVHTWGSRSWAMLELARSGQSWTGEVSCRDVSTVTGDTRYFFLALDASGQVVVGSGSPEWPHVATIVGSLPDGPQKLAGEYPPMRCHDPADCPPDFPGCPPYAVLRPACSSDGDCSNDARCEWDGYCGTPSYADVDEGADDDALLAAAVRKATGRYQTARASESVRR